MPKNKIPGGPRPHITLDVVQRVAARVGKGLPLIKSLSLEENPKINPQSWHKALQRNKDFATIFESHRDKFLDTSIDRLTNDPAPANLRWLLERRHADLFKKPDGKTEQPQTTVAGLSDDLLEQMRQATARRYGQTNPNNNKR